MSETWLASDFRLGNMADELLAHTLHICGKKHDDNPRFPRLLYDGYVNEIVRAAVTIQRDIVIANESELGEERLKLQNEAIKYCVWLIHLVRVAKKNGWISEQQQDRWSKMIVDVKWKTQSWRSSDKRRLGES